MHSVTRYYVLFALYHTTLHSPRFSFPCIQPRANGTVRHSVRRRLTLESAYEKKNNTGFVVLSVRQEIPFRVAQFELQLPLK